MIRLCTAMLTLTLILGLSLLGLCSGVHCDDALRLS